MKKNSDTTPLLLSIKNSIENFLSGNKSIEIAKKEYKEILTKYIEIENSSITSDNTNYLKGILYHHNVNNYSKLSSIFKYENDNLEMIMHYGNNKLSSILPEIIISNLDSIEFNNPTKIFLNKNHDLEFNLFLYKLNLNNLTIIIASISSSYYFNIDNFAYLSEMVSKVFSNIYNNNPLVISYPDNISQAITEYINSFSSSSKEISFNIDIYIFPRILEIFGHIGKSYLHKIPVMISKKLKESNPSGSKIFNSSFATYLVIYPVENTSTKKKKKRFSFHYNDINLPYKSKTIIIDNKKSIYEIFNDIFTFEHSILK